MSKKKEEIGYVEMADFYKPVMDYILCPYIRVEKTEGGVIIPQHLQEQNHIVKAVAVGPDVRNVKKGQNVFLAPNVKALIFELAGKEYIQIREMDVFGIVTDEYIEIDREARKKKASEKTTNETLGKLKLVN